MIDLKSALESVKYNTGALGSVPQQSQQPETNQQSGQNTGTLALILKKVLPTAISGGTIPPVA